ncbi:PREDICTED: uncharacterized protein LOC108360790 isoform X2 [Rhagoletis zephyria]|uniref:uncharacterized protein LOC108360790 isoform X2 n=1 Tax=Rhagoletis zephyria TaxID=28612 RepID=UPI0008117E55|nr:PREDICTED: uncharacterized protein LOC108360790 isoform X2 [Rhagoletis zephyria]
MAKEVASQVEEEASAAEVSNKDEVGEKQQLAIMIAPISRWSVLRSPDRPGYSGQGPSHQHTSPNTQFFHHRSSTFRQLCSEFSSPAPESKKTLGLTRAVSANSEFTTALYQCAAQIAIDGAISDNAQASTVTENGKQTSSQANQTAPDSNMHLGNKTHITSTYHTKCNITQECKCKHITSTYHTKCNITQQCKRRPEGNVRNHVRMYIPKRKSGNNPAPPTGKSGCVVYAAVAVKDGATSAIVQA